MFFAGDDHVAKSKAARLAEEIGFEAVDCGPLTHVRLLEPMAVLWIYLAHAQGMGTGIAFQLLRRSLTSVPQVGTTSGRRSGRATTSHSGYLGINVSGISGIATPAALSMPSASIPRGRQRQPGRQPPSAPIAASCLSAPDQTRGQLNPAVRIVSVSAS